MTREVEGYRFYVWMQGWSVRSAWRAYPPAQDLNAIDCTGMRDEEFDELMEKLNRLEYENTSPGHPGDPGRF